MACKVELLFFVIALSFGVCSTSSADYDYCVIGAGPGGIKLSELYLIFCQNQLHFNSSRVFFFSGLQMAYYLEKANRNYMVFERGSSAGKRLLIINADILYTLVFI